MPHPYRSLSLADDRLRLRAHQMLESAARMPNSSRRLQFIMRAIDIALGFADSPTKPDKKPDNQPPPGIEG